MNECPRTNDANQLAAKRPSRWAPGGLAGAAGAGTATCEAGETAVGGGATLGTAPAAAWDALAKSGMPSASTSNGCNDTFGRARAGGGVFTCNGMQTGAGGPTFGDTEAGGDEAPAGGAARLAGGGIRAPPARPIEAGREGGRELGRDLLATTRMSACAGRANVGDGWTASTGDGPAEGRACCGIGT